MIKRTKKLDKQMSQIMTFRNIACASSETSDKHAHMCSLEIAFSARDTQINAGPDQYLGQYLYTACFKKDLTYLR